MPPHLPLCRAPLVTCYAHCRTPTTCGSRLLRVPHIRLLLFLPPPMVLPLVTVHRITFLPCHYGLGLPPTYHIAVHTYLYRFPDAVAVLCPHRPSRILLQRSLPRLPTLVLRLCHRAHGYATTRRSHWLYTDSPSFVAPDAGYHTLPGSACLPTGFCTRTHTTCRRTLHCLVTRCLRTVYGSRTPAGRFWLPGRLPAVVFTCTRYYGSSTPLPLHLPFWVLRFGLPALPRLPFTHMSQRTPTVTFSHLRHRRAHFLNTGLR